MQINGMDAVKASFELESTARKNAIAGGQACHMLAAAGIGTICIYWYSNVLKMQSAFEDYCDDINCRYSDYILYDVAF